MKNPCMQFMTQQMSINRGADAKPIAVLKRCTNTLECIVCSVTANLKEISATTWGSNIVCRTVGRFNLPDTLRSYFPHTHQCWGITPHVDQDSMDRSSSLTLANHRISFKLRYLLACLSSFLWKLIDSWLNFYRKQMMIYRFQRIYTVTYINVSC